MRAGDCASQRRFDIATTAQKLQANGQPNDELCATVRRPRYVRVDVVPHVHAVIRQLGQLVEHRHLAASGCGRCRPVSSFHDRPPTLFSRPPRLQRGNELEDRLLTLGANHEVDERRFEHGVGVLRWKISAPDNRHVRQDFANAPAHGHGLRQLRTRHHGHGQQRQLDRRQIGRQARDDLGGRIAHDVAVDERPGFAAQRHRGPSSTAASAISDSGSGCLPGVVDSGLKRTIIAPPTNQTRPALVADVRVRAAAAAASPSEPRDGTNRPRRPTAPGDGGQPRERQKSHAGAHYVGDAAVDRETPELVVQHRATVTVGAEHRRVHHHQRAAGGEHPARLDQRCDRIRRVMQRSIQHNNLELRPVKWQRVKIGLHRREVGHRIVPRTPQAHRPHRRAPVHGDHAMAERRQPVRQPAAARSQIERANRPLRQSGREHVL